VEEPITEEDPSAMGCDILVSGDTVVGGGLKWDWVWQWTVVLDRNNKATFVNAPARKFKATQHPTGCCQNGSACPAYVPLTDSTWSFVYNSEVTAETSYSIWRDILGFYSDGTFARYTQEYIVNFDPISTDWCSSIPAYTIDNSVVYYFGTHNYVKGNSSISYITTRKQCDDPSGLCGYASRPGSIKFSCHTLMITVDRLMLENTKETRMYRRGGGNPEDYLFWRD
jgi:hypothetical protein